jgi:hypothetical protein
VRQMFSTRPKHANSRTPAALEHLTLTKLELTTSPPFVFSNLVTLTLNNARSFWSTSSFPSLRALCSTGTRGARYLPNRFPLGQLDLVQVDLDQNDGGFPQDFSQHYEGVPVLVRITTGFASLTAGRGPRLNDCEHLDYSFNVDGVRRVLDLAELLNLVRSHLLLKSLCLPFSLSPNRPPPSNLSLLRDDLLNECNNKGIDVVWRLNSMTPEDDACLSRDFWDYAKGLKKKKQLEAAVVGSSGGSK